MRTNWLIPLVALILLAGVAVAPAAAAAQPGGETDECLNADEGPGANGPPGFVADLVPDFLSDLIGSLPVPNFVKTLFGASTC
ncbi:histidine kinase [Haloparvum sedimenti]|uniref:histidine kinase n=1 Tax=Haloparvum sedimenti TaxID=1678448 RepID=UPI001FDEF2EC|nr:histidine kinase [Haloparvum sedimenti]